MTDFISDAPRRLLDAYAEGTCKGYGSTPVYPEWHGQEDRYYLGASKAGDCRRKMWFTLAPEFGGEPITVEKALLFSDGYLLEADTRARLQISGLMVGCSQREYIHPDEPRIRGHVDGLVNFIDNNMGRSVYVFEHKTMRAYPFSKLCGEKRGEPVPLNVIEDRLSGYILRPGTVNATNPHYFDQVQALLTLRRLSIMRLDGLDLGEQLCLFVVRSKETGMLAVEEIPSAYGHGTALIERMRSVLSDSDARRISPKDYDPTSKDWHCQYCEFKRDCIGIGDAVTLNVEAANA